jgi:hypothetical protein
MKLKKLCYAASLGAALCLAQSVMAWPDADWTGGANDGLWTSAANWTPALIPGIGGSGDTNGSIRIDPANGWSNVTITAGTTINLDASYATVYGPEWGVTLNIYGTLKCAWYLAPCQWDSAYPTTINMYDNGAYYAEGLGLGHNWWYTGGPYVNLNMYNNSIVGINWMWWGGRINLYDNSVLSITNGVTDTTDGSVSDSTRALNLTHNTTLVLPSSFSSTVTNWITRGILQVYGVPGDSAEIVIDTANATWPGRTVVTTTATTANPMLSIALTAPRTNLYVGGVEQAVATADYANNTNVTVTSLLGISYGSSDTSVATITSGGFVRAIGTGKSTLTVFFQTFSNSVTVTVGTYTNTATLAHRYSFSETSGTTIADSVGGSTWDGTIYGGATLDGTQLTLDGVDGYAVLPPGLVSNMDAISIEAWADFGGSANATNWATLFAFGNSDSASPVLGENYICFQPFTATATANALYGKGDPGYDNEQDATLSLVSNSVTNYLGNVSIAIVYNPNVGYVSLYTNGVLAVINSNVSNLLKETLGEDPLNYLGASLYGSDPLLKASINEFRIYNGPLTAGQIQADYALGPNQFIGTVTNVSLTASISGTNVLVTWPTNSALVTLMSSSALGSSASWSAASGSLVVAGGKYQMTVPATATAQFFRLQK